MGNKGWEAALAAVELAALKRTLHPDNPTTGLPGTPVQAK
jgi:hypothetical protein